MIFNTLDRVIAQYTLPLGGTHGVAHWARVLENGRYLSQHTGADLEVVSLFAVLHDSRRISENSDPEHGPRAAEFAAELCGKAFEIGKEQLELLCRACEGHTHERTHPDLTIQTCWDSDRLDLARVGIIPDPTRLCTDFARKSETRLWANGRAKAKIVPSFIMDEWGINLNLLRSANHR